MHKKSQIGSRLFIFIVAIMVFSLILLFGYKSIGSISEKGEQVRLIQLKTDLRNDITSLASEYGSVDINEYSLPLNVGEICFVDLNENNIDKGISPGLSKKFPIVSDQIEAGTNNNLFIFDSGGVYVDSLDVGDLDIKGPGWVCYKNENGRFKLELEGKGDGTGLREDFVVEDKFSSGSAPFKVTLEIEEIEGLEVHLETSDNYVEDVYVRLIVEKGNDPEKLTDNYKIQTLKNGVDYSTEINFNEGESYIKIPVLDCSGRAGRWWGIEPECEGNVAKYKIRSI